MHLTKYARATQPKKLYPLPLSEAIALQAAGSHMRLSALLDKAGYGEAWDFSEANGHITVGSVDLGYYRDVESMTSEQVKAKVEGMM